jgi:hypothetical protein
MKEKDIVLQFVQSCTSGSVGSADCSPVYACGGIAVALVIAVVALAILLKNRAKAESAKR